MQSCARDDLSLQLLLRAGTLREMYSTEWTRSRKGCTWQSLSKSMLQAKLLCLCVRCPKQVRQPVYRRFKWECMPADA